MLAALVPAAHEGNPVQHGVAQASMQLLAQRLGSQYAGEAPHLQRAGWPPRAAQHAGPELRATNDPDALLMRNAARGARRAARRGEGRGGSQPSSMREGSLSASESSGRLGPGGAWSSGSPSRGLESLGAPPPPALAHDKAASLEVSLPNAGGGRAEAEAQAGGRGAPGEPVAAAGSLGSLGGAGQQDVQSGIRRAARALQYQTPGAAPAAVRTTPCACSTTPRPCCLSRTASTPLPPTPLPRHLSQGKWHHRVSESDPAPTEDPDATHARPPTDRSLTTAPLSSSPTKHLPGAHPAPVAPARLPAPPSALFHTLAALGALPAHLPPPAWAGTAPAWEPAPSPHPTTASADAPTAPLSVSGAAFRGPAARAGRGPAPHGASGASDASVAPAGAWDPAWAKGVPGTAWDAAAAHAAAAGPAPPGAEAAPGPALPGGINPELAQALLRALQLFGAGAADA